MEKLRRPNLTGRPALVWAALAAACLAATQTSCTAQAAGPLSLNVSGVPGSLTLLNDSASEMNLQRTIQIEQKSGDKFAPIDADFYLLEDCAVAAKPALAISTAKTQCVRLAPHASITVVPWKGFSCSGQCNHSCRANIAYGPGTFRFVLRPCSGETAYYSGPFDMPGHSR